MPQVGVITLFPEMLKAVTDFGVSGRAVSRGLMKVSAFNPRDWATDAHRTVDDRPYGGGPGMVMQVGPLRKAIAAARGQLAGAPVVFMSPQGRRIHQGDIRNVVQTGALILVAGRYEGVDERAVELEADDEWSVGDYVVSGGELPAMIVIDAMCRLLPGALGDAASAEQDSFMAGLLDCPHYTRPETVDGLRVPEVLLAGNHEEIRKWRLKQALGRTWRRRPDLLETLELDAEQHRLLQEFIVERETAIGTGEES